MVHENRRQPKHIYAAYTMRRLVDKTGMNMTLKATSGPWHVRRDSLHFDSATCVVAGIAGNRKPFMYTLEASIGGDTDLETMEANTRLIAAAPDLYDALADFPGFMCGTNQAEMWLANMRKALAKARGEPC